MIKKKYWKGNKTKQIVGETSNNIWATSFGDAIILNEGGFSRGGKKQDLDARLFMIGDPQ